MTNCTNHTEAIEAGGEGAAERRQHETEPGCAVRAAIDAGELDPDRLTRWRKLKSEDAHNSETIAEARQRGRKFSKMVKSTMKAKRARRGER